MRFLKWLKIYGDDLCLFLTLECLVLQQSAKELSLSPVVMAWASFIAASAGVAHKVFFPAVHPPIPKEQVK